MIKRIAIALFAGFVLMYCSVISAFILLCLGVQILLDAGFKILKAHG